MLKHPYTTSMLAHFLNGAIKDYKKLLKNSEKQKLIELLGDQKLVVNLQEIIDQAVWQCGGLVHKKLMNLEFKEPKC